MEIRESGPSPEGRRPARGRRGDWRGGGGAGAGRLEVGAGRRKK